MMSDSIVSNSASTNSLAAETVPLVVRPSRDDDVNAMLDIYRRHIVRGVEPAFAHDPGTLQPDDIKRRRRNMRKHRLPHLVADRGGVVVGYAYAVLFRKRPAYRYAVKHSIYVHPCTPASAARCLDRRLRCRRFPADDRLYRCRLMRPRSACTSPAAFGRSVTFRRSPTNSANGPT